MADRMSFPETIEEFIDSFSFRDTEEVYTNGAELIPVFRYVRLLSTITGLKLKKNSELLITSKR